MPELNKEESRARRIAFMLLKFRSRSTKEITDRLKRKKISQEAIEKTVEFLRTTALLDDRDFAAAWVKYRIAQQLGIQRIRLELKQKGISEAVIDETLDGIKDSYREADIALELAKKKLKQLSGIDKAKARQRVYTFLVRKGFSFDVVNDIIQEI